MNKRGITPLLATFLLIIFAMLLGSVVMGFGKSYLEAPIPVEEETIQICRTDLPTTPLQALQVRHINGELTQEEYLALEERYR